MLPKNADEIGVRKGNQCKARMSGISACIEGGVLADIERKEGRVCSGHVKHAFRVCTWAVRHVIGYTGCLSMITTI